MLVKECAVVRRQLSVKPTLFSNIWNKLVCKDSRRYILIQNRSMKKSELDDNEPKPGLKVVK